MPIEVIMPRLGAVSEESKLVRWLIQKGDKVEQGQPLFEAESDKATVMVEAAASGTVGELLASPGEVIAAGQVIALLLAPGEELPAEPLAPEPAESAVTEQIAPVTTSKVPGRVGRLVATPRAKALARREGIDISTLVGTGPGGRITEADVKAALEKRSAMLAAAEVSPPPKTIPAPSLPLTGIRGTIARRMAESVHTTARVTITTEVDAEALVGLRQTLRANAGDRGEAISYDLLIAIIAAQALHDYPYMNASLTEKGIVHHEKINIGVAVDTERGLLVPVLKDVFSRRLLDLAADLEALVSRAREGKATPDDLTGGTFTITNLGPFGVDAFTPIINLPESAILGIGRITTKPVVRGDQIVVAQTMVLSLTFDHRLVDGAPAARFLQRIAQLIETPSLLLLRG